MKFQTAGKADRLGQGLDALLGEAAQNSGERPLSLNIELVSPSKHQSRQVFEETSLNELAESIKNHGVLQPILVKKQGAGYEIIAGERRWRAAAKAGLHKIPAIVKTPSGKEDHFWTLLENLQREDLNPLEEARAYQALLKSCNLNQQQLAQALGKPRPTLVNVLRLLNLNPKVQEQVLEGKLSLGLAKELLRVKSPAKQILLAEKCLANQWTVQQLRKTLEKIAPSDRADKKAGGGKETAPAWAGELAARLEKRFSRRVNLSFKKGKGQLTFCFQSEKELKDLAEKLCHKPPSF